MSDSKAIDQNIAALGDWRADTLSEIRRLIHDASPDILEEIKWRKPSNDMRGIPVWSYNGIICTGEYYKDKVKVTFDKGAALSDPSGLFNASLGGNKRRAIDIHEGEKINKTAFKKLIRDAMKRNIGSKALSKATKPKLLSGGNPQIPKGDGDGPVQAYIAAMPGWKHEIGRRLDALIVKTVPNVRKAIRWNTPFYGIEGRGWFLSFHCFTRYIKLTWHNGASLRPTPPEESKHPGIRYSRINESEDVDEKQLAKWIKQASKMPGEELF